MKLWLGGFALACMTATHCVIGAESAAGSAVAPVNVEESLYELGAQLIDQNDICRIVTLVGTVENLEMIALVLKSYDGSEQPHRRSFRSRQIAADRIPGLACQRDRSSGILIGTAP